MIVGAQTSWVVASDALTRRAETNPVRRAANFMMDKRKKGGWVIIPVAQSIYTGE